MDRAGLIEHILERHHGLDVPPDWIEDCLFTLVASALASIVDGHIAAGDRKAVVYAFETMRLAWRDGDDAVVNAVVVSFLSHINLKDGKVPRAWAWDVMPPMIRVPFESYCAQMEAFLAR